MKLLFTDLDGTLLNREKKISSENLKAIERASRQGNITIISTGRSLSSARPYIEELASVQEHCYAVTYNGGLIYDCISRKVIYKKTIPLPVFRRSTRKFPAFLFFSFFVSSSVPRFFLYLQQIFNALSGLFLLEKFF